MFLRVIILLLTTICFNSFAQKIETVYRIENDTTQNYYIVSEPDSSIETVLFLLPGMGDTPEGFIEEIGLDSLLKKSSILVVIGTPEGFLTHYLNPESRVIMNEMIGEVKESYQLNDDVGLVLGGFSIGGNGVLQYAQDAIQGDFVEHLSLKGVFTVDPPMDWEHDWHSMKRIIANNFAEVAVFEANFFLDFMTKNVGGAPEEFYENYVESSPFIASHPDGGNLSLLKDTPLRFYTEPDTLWWKTERNAEYEDLNCFSIDKAEAEFDSDKFEVIRTENRGVRSDGTRHPHSWSIVDEVELIQWINSL